MLSDLTQWLGAHSQWLGLAIFLVSLTESLHWPPVPTCLCWKPLPGRSAAR